MTRPRRRTVTLRRVRCPSAAVRQPSMTEVRWTVSSGAAYVGRCLTSSSE
ncbi:MAG TPA: hypothetical protein VFJ94_09265 [Intrasporangium sp.]|nr:hypothetical protein [Intrasporangium sp.]HET7398696.1 hypothetical protein [Intrasporangium sp.]